MGWLPKKSTLQWLVLIALNFVFIPISLSLNPIDKSFSNNANLIHEERILNYQSFITVNPDSSLDVTETIEVFSDQKQIKRGIYRDFPTIYPGKYGTVIKVGFKVKEVLRDGQQEQYTIEDIKNGKRIYIGKPDVLLNPGNHTYVISYTTNRQLGYFENYDELYWNVTGNGWIFPIEKVVARVTLPNHAPLIQKAAYTGILDAEGQDFTIDLNEAQNIIFKTTRLLAPFEGLTIAVAWPKGYVNPPTVFDEFIYFFQDNFNLIVAVFITFLIFIYYFTVWVVMKRGPRKGTIIPLFEPPKDKSPAESLYISKMGLDFSGLKQAFSASIVNMAVKGHIFIQKGESGGFILKKKESSIDNLSLEEKIIYNNLLSKSLECNLNSSNATQVRKTVKDFNSALIKNYTRPYFTNNHSYLYIGNLFSMAAIFAVLSLEQLLFVVAIFLINRFFGSLKRPTLLGRKLMDQIEGFILFLSVTETDRYKVLNSPEITPTLFEKYLPYAIAFDVEKQWSEKLVNKEAYQPDWYRDPRGNRMPYLALPNLGRDVTHSLSNIVTPASSSAPGSFSGSGGSGGSGRGGGGGGGGGW